MFKKKHELHRNVPPANITADKLLHSSLLHRSGKNKSRSRKKSRISETLVKVYIFIFFCLFELELKLSYRLELTVGHQKLSMTQMQKLNNYYV